MRYSASLVEEVAGFWQQPHRWVCHRGRSDITLAGSHCRDPPAIMSQAGLQARADSPDPFRGTRHVSVGFSPPRPSQAPPPERQKRCAGQGVRGSFWGPSVWASVLKSLIMNVFLQQGMCMCMGTRVWQSSLGRGVPDSILVPLTVSGSCWVAYARAPSSLLHVASVPGRLSCARVGIGYRAPPVPV